MTLPSVLEELLQALPRLRSQLYFKSSLTALSHAMEDQVLAGTTQPLVIANFQQERFYRQEAHRYLRIAEVTPQVYVLAAPETNFQNASGDYETIAFDPSDALSQEWHLVVIGQQYSACLICRERLMPEEASGLPADQIRRFEGIWTFDRQVAQTAANLLLDRVLAYRPELAAKVGEAKMQFLVDLPAGVREVDTDPFAQRLITYLQAGQYKLLKAYRSIAAQERKERLVNSIATAIRRSLDPQEILKVAVRELGQAMQVCRTLVYRCHADDDTAIVAEEYVKNDSISSLAGQTWPLIENPLFQTIAQRQELIAIADTQNSEYDLTAVQPLLDRWQIHAWVLAPVIYQGRLLGMVELQSCAGAHAWPEDDLEIIEAIATQLGVALIQAESYANLEDLNSQLEALDRTRSNLIAITGHELRTPLSTIQVCLESLAAEPDMPIELQQVMLSTALADAERMRKLVQDFITLSRLESGRVEWHLEAIALDECVDLALSSLRARQNGSDLPRISAQIPPSLPPARADGEWLVEVLSKLLDNACKFTAPAGEVIIEAHPNSGTMLEVTIRDTGRGIEPNRLEAVFDRFYQEEGSLRRTVGGTGLGLAICRQIILGLGGQIWAESDGRDRGSRFHFTLPIAQDAPPKAAQDGDRVSLPARKRRSTRNQATLS
ncbi:GAF domain-containing protein [Microcoleus sp. FACHB-1515]|uniref:DICT sensory domain-containing protein n=1 Tax=Cyanophyceae TaxID=3028117 RepID=UPI00168724CA|nr:DICT sensory domain-containing protein [Microcoleus sp. FACHB-1515]MBD2092497.1 GAF domain-containing protein [Microcoleus sp. FACHB-1515]